MHLADTINPSGFLKVIPTGSLPLDIALGIGGIPCGFITELYGAESSGKTTFCLSIVTEAQRSEGICAWIDADHALEAVYAAHCGVDLSRLLISQPRNSEQALDIALSLVNSQAIALVVIDSTTALVPRAELQGQLGKSYYQQQEQIMSQGLRKLSVALKHSETAVLLTSQLRHRKGIVHTQDQTSTAGLTQKLHAAIRLELRGPSKILHHGVFSGIHVQIKINKNKFVPTFPTIELELLYNQDICRIGDIFDLASQQGLIFQQNTAFFYGELPLGQDRESSLQKLLKDDHLVIDIEQALRQRLLPPIRLVDRK